MKPTTPLWFASTLAASALLVACASTVLPTANEAEQIAAVLRNAADAGDLTGGWGLPSMSGKELV